MRKVALVFVLAVLGPSLVLAWLAVRSLRDQQFVLERQQSLLYQGVADATATQVQDAIAEDQRAFTQHAARLAGELNSRRALSAFDDVLRTNWPLAQVGFVVTAGGEILSPSPFGRPEGRRFCAVNSQFLANRESAEVYLNQKQTASLNNNMPRKVNPSQTVGSWQKLGPQEESQQALSKFTSAEAEFRQLIGEGTDGALARFVDNKLNVLFWYRPPANSNLVLGAQVDLPRLIAGLRGFVDQIEPALKEDICLALLDDNAKPVALSRPGFQAAWKHPFVATEVGEALPHWEVAVYLLNPAKAAQAARTLEWTLGLLIAALVLAIGVGGWLIVSDLNRQLTLARQKTDFVSNVSHELKTPLTSIRMFSELLAEGRVSDPARQHSYLGIITAEAARLTRLINNVLDFARLERGEKKYHFQECDLVAVASQAAESYRPHLEAKGFRFQSVLPEAAVDVKGDRDALSQVLVNLLSNAEKYSNDKREIELRFTQHMTPLPYAELSVLDRGSGVPKGCEEKIFEQFYRVHDSLSSGIQGSGLGLTLARQIARAHGGEVVYQPRPGGGSCFSLRLPLPQTIPASPQPGPPRTLTAPTPPESQTP